MGECVSQYGPREVTGVFEGQILAGKYRVERVLGAGGMGVVVAAHHIGLDDKVAIKFLLPEMLSNAEAVNRFAREARNAVKIKGEHMARVFDVGTLETGAPYMVMEFLEGGDLHHWLQQRGPLSFEEAVDFVLQACEVLAEAHALGIVHRDLKPANLFCVRRADGRLSIKVLDFGISKVTSLGGSPSNLGMTRTGALMGSPFYMSPEQMEASDKVDARTDIWAIGVIIHELVTGKVPFPGETLPSVSRKIAERPPPPLRDSRPDAPKGLQAVVLRCLEKDRDRRYRNVAELAVALLPFGPKRARASVERITDIIQAAAMTATALSVPPSSESGSPPSPTETIAPFGGTASRTRGGKRTVVGVLAATGTLGLVAVMAFALVARRGPTTDTEDPALSSANVLGARPTSEPPPTSTQTAAPIEAISPPREIMTPSPQPRVHAGMTPSPKPTTPAPASSKPVGTGPAKTTTASVQPSSGQVATGLPAPTASAPPAPPPKPTASHADVPAAATPNCNPPYVIDSAGYRQYKPECLHRPEKTP